MFFGNNNSCGCEWIIWIILIVILLSYACGNGSNDCGCNSCGNC